MKPSCRFRTVSGFTQADASIVVLTLVLVTGVFLYLRPFAGREHDRRSCVHQLKELALAAKQWSIDYESRFPWQLSTNDDGTLEFTKSPEAFRHFAAMSNYLESPLTLVCPNDRNRSVAEPHSVSAISNHNVSYLIGLDAHEDAAQAVLFGDRNIVGGMVTRFGFAVRPTDAISWTSTIHSNCGNIVLANGSVLVVRDDGLRKQLSDEFTETRRAELRFAVPRVPGETGREDSRLDQMVPYIGAWVGLLALVVAWRFVRRGFLTDPLNDSNR